MTNKLNEIPSLTVEEIAKHIGRAVAPYAFKAKNFYHNDKKYADKVPFTDIETEAQAIYSLIATNTHSQVTWNPRYPLPQPGNKDHMKALIRNHHPMKFYTHIDVSVDWALREAQKGNNISAITSLEETLKALKLAKAEGKRFYTGCDNTDHSGKCKGHPVIEN